jgi:Protein of unknown function (DUF2568)
MIRMISQGNLALAFALELAGLTAFGYWGVRTGTTTLTSAALGTAAPVTAAILWGVFAAPRASVSSMGAAVATKVVFFLAATLALYATAHHGLAATFLALVVISSMLSYLKARGDRLDRANHASARPQISVADIQPLRPHGRIRCHGSQGERWTGSAPSLFAPIAATPPSGRG